MIDREHLQTLTEAPKDEWLRVNALKLAQLEDDNQHTEYVIHLAKMLKDKRSTAAAKAIEVLHDFFGHMPVELLDVRRSLSDSLFNKLHGKLGAKATKQFYAHMKSYNDR